MGSDRDSLWIGVDGMSGNDVPSLNVFRRVGMSFELVKIISGEEAVKVYDLLTKEGLDSVVTELVL